MTSFRIAGAALVLATVAATGLAGADELRWISAERSYLLHVPAHADGRPLPLVIALHGAGGDAAKFADATKFADAADAQGMIVAFPNGTPGTRGGRTFNAHFCCGEAVRQEVDDVGFIGAIIDDIARHYPLDRQRVYATGMSNGGMLAYVLAAAHPEWFAGIAPVSAAIGGMTRDGRTYLIPPPGRPVSVMIIHGEQDRIVPYEGGSSAALNFPNWKLSVADAFTFWAAVDGCRDPPEVETAAEGVNSRVYAACAARSTVRLWTIEHGDHSWPEGIFPGGRSAAAEILAFFAGLSRSGP